MKLARNRRAWQPNKLAKKYLTEFEKMLSPADLLRFIMRQSVQEGDKWHILANLMQYGSQNRMLASLALEAGLSYGEIMQAYIKELHQNAILKQATHTEGILLDIAVDARSTSIMCDECHGSGSVQDKGDEEGVSAITCPKCEGIGKVRKVGDKDARDQFLKVQKLIDTGKGIIIDNRRQTVEVPQSVADIIRGAARVMEGDNPQLGSGNGEHQHREIEAADAGDAEIS